MPVSEHSFVASSQQYRAPAPVSRVVADGLAPEIGQLLAGTASAWVTVPGSALAVITQALGAEQVDVLHIVGHGRTGRISLGGHWLDASALLEASESLARWKVSSIALWSCDVGQNDALVQMLRLLTGARVFASSRALGMVDGQARWVLDGAAANELPAAPFDPAIMASWPHTLD